MHNCFPCNFRYLRTPMGAVKLVNVIIGAISLILVSVSYVPGWTLSVFIGTVAGCLFLSILYGLFYVLCSSRLIQSKANRVVSFLYHVLAGIALIVAGIELIGWSEYTNPACKHNNCPHLYTVGVAKTLTFMNGTLYLIVGFLGIKDDDLLDPEAADEDIPLLSNKTALASIPGGLVGSKQTLHNGYNQSFYYDNFFRQPKVPYDLRSNASSYRNQFLRPPPHHITEDYTFNNSCNSPCNNGHHTGTTTVTNGNGNNGRRTKKHSTSSINTTNSLLATSVTIVDV